MSIAASTDASPADQSVLLQALSDENTQLKRQLAWFKTQLFGSKSEKRVIDNPDQPLLTGLMGDPVEPLPPVEKQKITYERGTASLVIDPVTGMPDIDEVQDAWATGYYADDEVRDTIVDNLALLNGYYLAGYEIDPETGEPDYDLPIYDEACYEADDTGE